MRAPVPRSADKPLFDLGYVDRVTSVLDSMGMHHRVFYDVAPDPTRTCIEAGVAEINEFRWICSWLAGWRLAGWQRAVLHGA